MESEIIIDIAQWRCATGRQNVQPLTGHERARKQTIIHGGKCAQQIRRRRQYESGHIGDTHNGLNHVAQAQVFGPADFYGGVDQAQQTQATKEGFNEIVNIDGMKQDFAKSRHKKEERIDAHHAGDMVDKSVILGVNNAASNNGISDSAVPKQLFHFALGSMQTVGGSGGGAQMADNDDSTDAGGASGRDQLASAGDINTFQVSSPAPPLRTQQVNYHMATADGPETNFSIEHTALNELGRVSVAGVPWQSPQERRRQQAARRLVFLNQAPDQMPSDQSS